MDPNFERLYALFAPLPPPAIFLANTNTSNNNDNNDDDDDEATTIVVNLAPYDSMVIDTPPLVIREDLYEVIEITQEEFLQSIPGWTPTPINHRF